MKIHEKYLKRCLQLAKNGFGSTYPNPMVGAVIVFKERIIGEGWHHKAGEAHAEVHAIHSVSDESLLKKATLYVSLEPCSHFGKTPPCSDLIIAKGIKKVVIGMVDPFPEVSGKGIKKLMDAGCEVRVGVLEDECAELNKRFLTFHLKKRPFIILKWAQTQDGFMAPEAQNERRPVWISNAGSKQLVHKWRSEEQAILVGTNTVIKDNPKLDVRLWGPIKPHPLGGKNNPVRIVIDKDLKIPKDSRVFDGKTKTIVLCEHPKKNRKNLIFESIDFNDKFAKNVCEILYSHKLQSVIIEGGRKTLQTFIDAGLWDEARIFTGTPVFKAGTEAPKITGRLVSEEKILSDTLKTYRND